MSVTPVPVPVARAMDKYPRIETLFVDNDYAGQCAAMLRDTHQLNVHVVRLRPIVKAVAGAIRIKASYFRSWPIAKGL